MRTVCEVANTISALSLAPDPGTCSEVFNEAVSQFAIDAFSCGEVDLNVMERTVFYSIRWPTSFRRFYFGAGMMRRDPMIDGLRNYHEPFTWSDLRRERKWKAIGTEGLQVIADHGWTEGLAVPIPRGGERIGLVSLMFRDRRPEPRDKSLLAMLSYSFHERLRNLVPRHGFALPPAGLTRREIDTLRLIALGDTDRKVARKLGISPSTAHEHLEKAKRKLKASTRAGAIAIAVSLGIVGA